MIAAVQVPTPGDWAAIGVEVTLAATIVCVLVLPFFSRSSRAIGVVAIAGLAMAFVATFLPERGGYKAFSGLILVDPAATLWRQVLLTSVAGVIGIWFATTSHDSPDGDAPEFMTLLLSATLGLSLMGATAHLLMLLLAMELASLPSYVLAGFRKRRPRAAEAALKFVLFGAVCTAIMIYGSTLLYGSAGTLDLGAWLTQTRGVFTPVAVVGLMLLMVGLLFKLSAVPGHFWCPDVFEGTHVDVAAFLSIASKGAGVMLLLRLWQCLGARTTAAVAGMAAVLAVVAVVTTFVGNLGALRQASVKRLLAYSSIAHAGYLLSAMAVLPAGRSAAIAYLVVYALMTLGVFAVVAGVEWAAGSDDVAAFDGLSSRAPVAALAMTVCLVSMVGLPPTAGFLVKWKVMSVLAAAGGAWWWVVASVAVNSVISLAYYARILRAMYRAPTAQFPKPPAVTTWIAAACAAALIVLLVLFAPLEQWAADAVFRPPAAQTP